MIHPLRVPSALVYSKQGVQICPRLIPVRSNGLGVMASCQVVESQFGTERVCENDRAAAAVPSLQVDSELRDQRSPLGAPGFHHRLEAVAGNRCWVQPNSLRAACALPASDCLGDFLAHPRANVIRHRNDGNQPPNPYAHRRISKRTLRRSERRGSEGDRAAVVWASTRSLPLAACGNHRRRAEHAYRPPVRRQIDDCLPATFVGHVLQGYSCALPKQLGGEVLDRRLTRSRVRNRSGLRFRRRDQVCSVRYGCAACTTTQSG